MRVPCRDRRLARNEVSSLTCPPRLDLHHRDRRFPGNLWHSGAKIFFRTGSTALETLGRPCISNPIASHHDNSIDEMVGMLLDDTRTVLDPTGSVAVKHVESPEDKDLPQIPKLLFNADDAWAHRIAPVVTAAGNVNTTRFLDGSEVADSSTSHVFGQSTDPSKPPIPRRVRGFKPFMFHSTPVQKSSKCCALDCLYGCLVPVELCPDPLMFHFSANCCSLLREIRYIPKKPSQRWLLEPKTRTIRRHRTKSRKAASRCPLARVARTSLMYIPMRLL